MRIQSTLRAIAIALVAFSGGSPAYASFHFMQIEQVIGGVDGDTSAQAIQLRMRSGGQRILSAARLVVRDAAGLNPILVKDMTSNVDNGLAGDRVLIVSSNFANYSSPAVSPNFTMTRTIPASYLAAGRLTFEDDAGTIYWSLSWGGSGYTGPQTGSTVNDANGNFGPAVTIPLPSTSFNALKFSGAASALSTANSADYALTPGAATFVNNARTSFTVFLKPRITAINRESNNIRVTWMTTPGKTHVLQRTDGTAGGDYFTNYTDIFSVTNSPGTVTNYLDIGAITNFPSGFYRVRLVP